MIKIRFYCLPLFKLSFSPEFPSIEISDYDDDNDKDSGMQAL